MKRENVEHFIYDVIINKVGLEANYFQTHSDHCTFKEIDCDLLTLFEIIEATENKYKIMIDDSTITDMTTVGDFIGIVIDTLKL